MLKPWGRLFDDACDEGFRMKSIATGKLISFYLAETVKWNDGEIISWRFEHYDPSGLSKWRITIFND